MTDKRKAAMDDLKARLIAKVNGRDKIDDQEELLVTIEQLNTMFEIGNEDKQKIKSLEEQIKSLTQNYGGAYAGEYFG